MKKSPYLAVVEAMSSTPFMAFDRGLIDLFLNGLAQRADAAWDDDDDGDSIQDQVRLPVEMRGNVAVVKLDGLLLKGVGVFRYFRITDVDLFAETIVALRKNPAVKAVAVKVESPGGTVAGVQEAAGALYDCSQVKPVVVHSGSTMASAAMWIGAAGNHVMATPTASVGSIGVYYSHFDFSELNTKIGIKVTEIVSGKWKGLGSEDRPLSKDDKNKIQEQVDYLATTFISDVARFRDLQPEKVAALEAGILFGEEALKVGLIDAVGTFDDALEKARELSKKTSKTRVVMKTLQDQLKAQFPDHESCIDSVCAQAKAHFTAEQDKEVAGLKAEKDAEIGALKSQVDETTAALAAAKDTISRLTAVAVDNVWKAALSGTAIPENLHGDMKALIAVPTDGQLDITAFAAAVSEKVALWEKNFKSQQAAGAPVVPTVDGHGAPDAEAEAPPAGVADEGYTADEIKARKSGTGLQ